MELLGHKSEPLPHTKHQIFLYPTQQDNQEANCIEKVANPANHAKMDYIKNDEGFVLYCY